LFGRSRKRELPCRLLNEGCQEQCGHWNKFKVNKVFIEQPSQEARVKVVIPLYEPLKIVKCEKCGEVIAEPKESISITNPTVVRIC